MEKKVSTVHFHDWGMDFLKSSSIGQKLRKKQPECWNSVLYIKSLVKTKQNKNKLKRRGRAKFKKRKRRKRTEGRENKGRWLIAPPPLQPCSRCLPTPCSPPSRRELLASQSPSRHHCFCPTLSFLSPRSLSCILQTLF